MRRIIFYTLFIFLWVLTSCNTTKRLANDNGPAILNGISETSEMLDLVSATDIPYTWFGAEGNGTIDWEGNRYTAKIRVRILHDSIIWVQIQKFGFEVGRMLVTPDSAFFINRLERSYSLYKTNDFFKKYNLPADFNMFSKVFTGGAYVPPLISKSKIEDDRSLYLESSNGVNARLWLDVTSTLVQSLVTDPFNHQWEAGYADYKATNTGQLFPYRRTNTLVNDGVSNLFDLDYTSIEINVPQEFPFSIPSHYDKI
ncbi:MAG: DUF4292 domain-containing protein [Saprospiraceae bacterium]